MTELEQRSNEHIFAVIDPYMRLHMLSAKI